MDRGLVLSSVRVKVQSERRLIPQKMERRKGKAVQAGRKGWYGIGPYPPPRANYSVDLTRAVQSRPG